MIWSARRPYFSASAAEFNALIVANRNGYPVRLRDIGRAEVRKTERRLAGWYRDALLRALSRLRRDNREVVLAVAELPERIRGYEEHKLTSAAEAGRRAAELLLELERASLPVLSSA